MKFATQSDWRLLAIDAALEAGRAIRQVYDDPSADFQVERKADNSPLTIADRQAHGIIASILQETGLPVLSEEGRTVPYEERAAWPALWIVDPLDGTKEFIKRNGEFTVNIARVEGNLPTFGVVYVPAQHTLYWGDTTSGAWRLDGIDLRAGRSMEELAASGLRLPCCSNREDYVVVASRSHLSPETEEYLARRRKTYPDLRLLSVGSSLKICRVAEGWADEYPRLAPTMEWDTAAGQAVAMAAGAEVRCASTGHALVYNKPDLHNPWFIVSRNNSGQE